MHSRRDPSSQGSSAARLSGWSAITVIVGASLMLWVPIVLALRSLLR
jgi:hypothetical protein